MEFRNPKLSFRALSRHDDVKAAPLDPESYGSGLREKPAEVAQSDPAETRAQAGVESRAKLGPAVGLGAYQSEPLAERRLPEPDRYDVARDRNPHLAIGFGVR